MPGIYASRATKFLYLDGARMTGESGPLTKSESETELLAEQFMPEGSARGVVVQSGISNEMITLEGYARARLGCRESDPLRRRPHARGHARGAW